MKSTIKETKDISISTKQVASDFRLSKSTTNTPTVGKKDVLAVTVTTVGPKGVTHTISNVVTNEVTNDVTNDLKNHITNDVATDETETSGQGETDDEDLVRSSSTSARIVTTLSPSSQR